jgi:hypothetical protein
VEVLAEKCGNLGGLRGPTCEAIAACSACAGDYEDPDRTAWSEDQRDEADESGNAQEQGNTVERTQSERASVNGKAIDKIAERRNNDERQS